MTNRNYTETENSLGFYLNTLPIRKKINDSASFNELLKEVKNKFLDVYNNKDYPFERLIEKLNPERDTSRNPLFNIFFEYLNPVNNQKPIELIGLKVENMGSEQKTVKFDIRFRLIERLNGKIRLVCDYNTDLFKAETISNYINILSAEEEQGIIEQLTGEKTKENKFIVQDRLSASFKNNKERVAIECGSKKIKYQDQETYSYH